MQKHTRKKNEMCKHTKKSCKEKWMQATTAKFCKKKESHWCHKKVWFFFGKFFTKHVLATWQWNSSRGNSLFLLAACLRLLTCVTRRFLLSECEISPMNLKTKGTEAYSNFTAAQWLLRQTYQKSEILTFFSYFKLLLHGI